jgi:hypothetical protein
MTIHASQAPGLMKTAETRTTMFCLMDKILQDIADRAYEAARLRRNGVHTTPDLVSAEMLGELEASGDAMRFVNANGRIAWRATPNLCQYLNDLELDAEDDLEDI